MKQTILAVIFCIFLTSINGNSQSNSSSYLNFGVRSLSVQSLNDALKSEGLAELKPIAFSVSGFWDNGFAIWDEPFVFNGSLSFLSSRNKEDLNLTCLWGLGFSLDFGYQIWKNDKMFLFPFVNLTYMVPYLKTQQKTDAQSFGAVYNQPLLERSFTNNGELDGALGLTYCFRIGKRDMLGIRGGYNYSILRSKWRYSDKKIDFPKMDCRGWEIGIIWVTNVKSKKQKE